MSEAVGLKTVGIYVQPPTKAQLHYLDFYKECGYNYLEYCETGFGIRPDLLPAHYAEVAKSIEAAQKKGFRVWILLLAGMQQWKGPGQSGGAGTFSALDTELLQERLSFIRQAVRGLKNADGFQFFAGDPGGDPQGRSTVKDCIAFSREVQQIVREEAPKARFAINVWAIAEWAGFPSPFSLDFWQKQVVLSRAIAQEPGLLGKDTGVLFSLDNYYRSLTLRCYSDAGIEPERYPLAADVEALRKRGVSPILGWPYFLVDECDDGFITPNNVVTKGQSQAETRYIRAIVDHGIVLGLDGLVTNASFVAAEPLNIYAFARMCREPKLTPERVLEDYARLIADDATRPALVRVLKSIENHSNWQNSLPPEYRLRDMDAPSIEEALKLIDTVVPRAAARMTLPEPPTAYLERLKKRLLTVQSGEIGGPNPHYKPQARQGR